MNPTWNCKCGWVNSGSDFRCGCCYRYKVYGEVVHYKPSPPPKKKRTGVIVNDVFYEMEDIVEILIDYIKDYKK